MRYTLTDIQRSLAACSKHAFFDYLDEKVTGGGLSAQEYQIFANNFVARTLFTIPEVTAATHDAAMDLRPLGVAYGAMTLNEEAGAGDPSKNHAALMVNAINYHGTAVYGDAYQPVNPRDVMNLLKAYTANWQLASIYQQRGEENLSPLERDLLPTAIPNADCADYLFSQEELHEPPAPRKTIGQTVSHALAAVSGHVRPVKTIADRRLENVCERLLDMRINLSLAEYAWAQLGLMQQPKPGALAGCAFAHESLADGMMFHVFKLLYSAVDQYPGGEAAFDAHVYPYFSAHGDYKAMLRGEINVSEGDGVEAEHARRELEKLSEVMERGDEYTRNALDAAKQFIGRQRSVWSGMLYTMRDNPERRRAEEPSTPRPPAAGKPPLAWADQCQALAHGGWLNV